MTTFYRKPFYFCNIFGFFAIYTINHSRNDETAIGFTAFDLSSELLLLVSDVHKNYNHCFNRQTAQTT